MTAKKWIATCKFFLQPHPELHPAGEEVYIPRRDLVVTLWFEGGMKVSGDVKSLQLNFNSADYLVLCHIDKRMEHIFRVPWKRLVSFEIAIDRGSDSTLSRRFFLNGHG